MNEFIENILSQRSMSGDCMFVRSVHVHQYECECMDVDCKSLIEESAIDVKTEFN